MANEKKLMRSSANKVLAGVCGGIGEYLDVDPTVIRVLYVVLSCFVAGFPGLLLYIILMIIIPVTPVSSGVEDTTFTEVKEEKKKKSED